MPHGGGGSGSGGGGFHSGSGGVSSAPRYDSHGNLHSTYYVRPGFYYNHIYVPYDPKSRFAALILGPICSLIIVVALCFFTFFIYKSEGTYDEEMLLDYGCEKYAEVYNTNDKSYEYNILICIVTYDDSTDYDYISIVGDEINIKVDEMFGNQRTDFGSSVLNNVKKDNNFKELYKELGLALDEVTQEITKHYYSGNVSQPKIVNESNYKDILGESEFLENEDLFYKTTGYHVSIIVLNNNNVYKTEKFVYFILIGFAIITLIAGVVTFSKKYKATKVINQAQKEKKEGKYFEGEDTYEEFLKKNREEFEKYNNDFK